MLNLVGSFVLAVIAWVDVDLEVVKVVSSPYATHVRYAITK